MEPHPQADPHVVVVGAGIVGVSTAYFLARAGHRVTVVDERAHPALGTSHANAGYLRQGTPSPQASPSLLQTVAQSFLPSLSGAPSLVPFAIVRPGTLFGDPDLWRWGLHFLRACLRGEGDASRRGAVLGTLSVINRALLDDIVDREALPTFHLLRCGVLELLPDSPTALADAAAAVAHRDKKGEGSLRVLDLPALRAVVPELAADGLAGAIHAQADVHGDCNVFTRELAQLTRERYGARFLVETRVTELEYDHGRLRGIAVAPVGTAEATECLPADAVVLCQGVWTNSHLLQSRGIYVPIYPVKGYSVSIGSVPFEHCAIDTANHFFMGPGTGGSGLRVAAVGEFAGHNAAPDPHVVEALVAHACRLLGLPRSAVTDADTDAWSGLRPQSADDVPVVDHVLPGVWINTGHGSMGWRTGIATSYLVADRIGRTLDPNPRAPAPSTEDGLAGALSLGRFRLWSLVTQGMHSISQVLR